MKWRLLLIICPVFGISKIPSTAAQTGKATVTAEANFELANKKRMECLSNTSQNFAKSKDPIEAVTDAVLHFCQEELLKFELATKAHLPSLGWEQIHKSRETQKKTVMSWMVALRLQNSESPRQITASLTPEPKVDAKTREGKIADCDFADAEFRRWAYELGNVRVPILEEHQERDEKCRDSAKLLPQAADFHKAN